MNIEDFQGMVKRQLIGALLTLGQSIEAAGEEEWGAEHVDGTVSQVVHHTLFYADLYMNPSPEGFEQQQFHLDHPDFFQDYQEKRDEVPSRFYSRKTSLDYLEFCIEKAERATAAETEESLAGPSGFHWYPCTRAEMYLINIRHIQHHAAQLGLRRQILGEEPLKWVSGLRGRS
jgi:hypothetical protein